MNPQDSRLEQLKLWVDTQLGHRPLTITPVSGDASFRRYFRVETDNPRASLIAMDAPPDKENSQPFVTIAQAWYAAGIPVPQLHHIDLEQGFILLEDQGDTLLLPAVQNASSNSRNADTLYKEAIDTLLRIQQLDTQDPALPPYDTALLQREMALFSDWLCEKQLRLTLNEDERQMLLGTFNYLEAQALAQPQVVVHRDYHSRNLMVLNNGLGILDFQDAVIGPATYDLVSLLRDCYIVWPPEDLQRWLAYYHQQATDLGLVHLDLEDFRRAFDLMGIQRHLKAAGIFARLSIRDGKHSYLNDIPRTVAYIRNVGEAYPELAPFMNWLDERFLPVMRQELAA